MKNSNLILKPDNKKKLENKFKSFYFLHQFCFLLDSSIFLSKFKSIAWKSVFQLKTRMQMIINLVIPFGVDSEENAQFLINSVFKKNYYKKNGNLYGTRST